MAAELAAGQAAVRPVELTIPLAGPLDLAASCAFLRRHGDDLIDRYDGERLTRVLLAGGRRVAVSCRPVGSVRAPAIAVTAPPGTANGAVVALLAGQFGVPGPAWPALLAQDSRLAALEAHRPGIRPLRLSDPLYALVRAITAQQISLGFATRVRARVAARYGRVYDIPGVADPPRSIEPDTLAGAAVSDLRALQLSERKATYLVEVATAVADGRVSVAELSTVDTETVVRRLTAIRGIGRWTAEWFAARVLGRAVVVAGDIAVRKAVGAVYGVPAPTEPELRRMTAHWGQAASFAQQVVLESF